MATNQKTTYGMRLARAGIALTVLGSSFHKWLTDTNVPVHEGAQECCTLFDTIAYSDTCPRRCSGMLHSLRDQSSTV